MKSLKKPGGFIDKRVFLLIMACTGSILLYSCHSDKAGKQQGNRVYYTCPMHHRVHSDKPGKCPICGMTLEKIMPSSSLTVPVDSSLRYLVQPVNRVVVGNYKVISPERAYLHDTIHAYGRIGFDESSVGTVSTLVTGRIEKLYVKYIHQKIHRGQPLMKIYSPKLLSAERDLRQAVRDNDEILARALKQQLLNLGMSGGEIGKVADSGEIIPDVTVYSPYNGILADPASDITAAAIPGSRSLHIREGMYVTAGQTVFTIQSIHQTRAILNVFNRDLSKIKIGDKVFLSADADPAKITEGKISFIPPYRNDHERTAAIRVYIPAVWKIGTLIRGRIIPENKETGWRVPATAVTRLGRHAVVWVQNPDHPGVYEKREVQAGEDINDSILIASGLDKGDKVVENAAYMVDSDDFIQ